MLRKTLLSAHRIVRSRALARASSSSAPPPSPPSGPSSSSSSSPSPSAPSSSRSGRPLDSSLPKLKKPPRSLEGVPPASAEPARPNYDPSHFNATARASSAVRTSTGKERETAKKEKEIRMWKAMDMFIHEGKEVTEIAQELGRGLGTIRTYFIDLAVARPDTIGQMVEVNWPRISFGLDDMYSSRTCRSLDEAIEAREEAKALARKKSRR